MIHGAKEDKQATGQKLRQKLNKNDRWIDRK